MADKIFWRCYVCNDIHYGIAPPEICPTCSTKNAYVETDAQETKAVMRFDQSEPSRMDQARLLRIYSKFTEKNDFKINPDKKIVDMLLKAELAKLQKFSMKLCPCRIRDKTFETDLALICPCNFKLHPEWTEKGMCHCGLFVKR